MEKIQMQATDDQQLCGDAGTKNETTEAGSTEWNNPEQILELYRVQLSPNIEEEPKPETRDSSKYSSELFCERGTEILEIILKDFPTTRRKHPQLINNLHQATLNYLKEVESIVNEETTLATEESGPECSTFEVIDVHSIEEKRHSGWDLAASFQKHSIQENDQHHIKNNQGHTSELHQTNFKGVLVQDSDDSIDTKPESDNIVPGRSFTYNQIDALLSSLDVQKVKTSCTEKNLIDKLIILLAQCSKDKLITLLAQCFTDKLIIFLAQCFTMYSELRTEFPELAKSFGDKRNKICHPHIQNCTQEIFEIIILLLLNNNIITQFQAEFFIKFWKERPKNPSGPQKKKAQRRQAQDKKKKGQFQTN